MPASLTIHQATLEDIDSALPLLEQFYAEEGFATPPELMRDRLAAVLAHAESAVLLAWQGVRAVGVATISTSLGFEFGRTAEMEDLFVLPEARSAGVGSALIEAALAWCRAQDREVLAVVVTSEGQQHDLIYYYETHGFAASGRTILFHPL